MSTPKRKPAKAKTPARKSARKPALRRELGEDWPPAQDCGDVFTQTGSASAPVQNCSEIPPAVLARLVNQAKSDAMNKATFRCPNRCPAVIRQWNSNRTSCENRIATLYVEGTFRCT